MNVAKTYFCLEIDLPYMVHIVYAIFQQVCISKSAVRTKFEQHSQRGRNITSSLRSVMDETHKKSQKQG